MPVEKLSVPVYVFVPDRELDFLTDSHVKLDTDCILDTDFIDADCITKDCINANRRHANCIYTDHIIQIYTIPIHMI